MADQGERIAELEARLAAAEAELERTRSTLAQLTYAVSHDLQEPLRTVGGFVKLLQRENAAELSKDAQDYLRFIGDGTRRMRELIRGLLEYSRVESRGKPFAWVDARALVERAVASLGATAADADIAIGALPTVHGDADQLAGVFQRLIDNAVKFHGPGQPCIEIDAHQSPDGGWVIRVADDGPGIDPDRHDRIFEMFGRGPDTADLPGTGCGLTMCRRILERHGGTIDVRSDADAGATFVVTFPAA